MKILDVITRFTGGGVREALSSTRSGVTDRITEIRVRLGKPLVIRTGDGEHFVCADGTVSDKAAGAYLPGEKDIALTVELISEYSPYAFREEVKNGFITIAGGHRVGICGKCVVENGHIVTIRNISGLSFRIAHEVKDCAKAVMPYVTVPRLYHTMIVSPPGCGKTTFLRDLTRLLSNGGYTVGVADERGEIAGSKNGKPQNDVGIRTDVLDGCPKAEGMVMLLRAMSPNIIAVDEIGKKEDSQAVTDVLNAGVKLICTAHGADLDDLMKRPVLAGLINDGVFERFVVLKGGGVPGVVEGIYDAKGKKYL